LNAVTTRDKKSDAAPSTKKDDARNNQPDQQESVSSDEDIQEVVFVMQKDGKVKKYPVKTDIQDINYIQILQGLKPGDEVITGPYDVVSKQLKDGMKVKVVPKEQLVQDIKKT
jgi:HlyD family secretion protein